MSIASGEHADAERLAFELEVREAACIIHLSELDELRKFRNAIGKVLDAGEGQDILAVARDRMHWRARHAHEAEIYGRRSSENWKRAKRYQEALTAIANGEPAVEIARNALGSVRPDGTPVDWPRDETCISK